jgi:hypothetical protein
MTVPNWHVIRIDDNGFSTIIAQNLSKHEADILVEKMEARGHKQTYIAESEEQRANNN